METFFKAKKLLFVVFLCMGVMWTIKTTQAIASEPVIIVNDKVPDNALSATDVKNIFLGKKVTWEDGQKISFVVLEAGDTHTVFLKEYVKKSTAQFRNYWRNLLFTGKGVEPKSFASETDLMEYVSGNDGMIGYISKETPVSGVKVIAITQ